jgi:hypothetical protein
LIASELIREGNAFAKKKEKAMFPDSKLCGINQSGPMLLNHRGEESWLFVSPFL